MGRSDLYNLLNKSFHLFRVVGFDVRIHWTVFVYLLIALRIYTKDLNPNESATPLLFAITATLMLFLIVLIHELGHAITARRLGLHVDHIQLNPIGGFAAIDGKFRTARDEFLVTLWGPLVHPILLVFASLPFFLTRSGTLDLGPYGNELVEQFVWINLVLFVINLIPAFPLDGGRLLRSYLAGNMDATRATLIAALAGQIITVLAMVVAVIFLTDWIFPIVFLGLICLITCEQVKVEVREHAPYDGFEGLSFYSLPEEPKPGPLRRYIQERAERKRRQEAERELELKARVDQLLEKVSEVGVDGLTPPEKTFLRKASSYYKRPKT